MIHLTAVIPRFTRLRLATAAAVPVMVFGAACGGPSKGVAGYSATSGVATLMPMGMTMAAGTDVPAAPAVAGNQVSIQNFNFGPGAITVSAGSTVTWSNDDSVTHTVTAADGSFDSSDLAPGHRFSYTFTTPGTYTYHCSIHPFMTGQVVVQ